MHSKQIRILSTVGFKSTHSLTYLTFVVQMPVSENGWIRTQHKRICEEAS